MKTASLRNNLLSSMGLILTKMYVVSAKLLNQPSKKKNNGCDDAKTVVLSCRKYYDDNPNVPKLEWINLLNRKVFLIDYNELGRIEAVNKNTIVIKRGSFRLKRYYITPNMLMVKSTKTKTSNHRIRYPEKNDNLFLDLVFDEAKLYQSNRIPNPNVFATLGTSYRYMPQPYSKWNQQQKEE